jgi:hypothetical protein
MNGLKLLVAIVVASYIIYLIVMGLSALLTATAIIEKYQYDMMQIREVLHE